MSKFVIFLIIFCVNLLGAQDEFDVMNEGDASSGNYSMKKNPDKNKCMKNKYGLKKLMNQEVELQYCFEHGGRTCCNNNDVMPIR